MIVIRLLLHVSFFFVSPVALSLMFEDPRASIDLNFIPNSHFGTAGFSAGPDQWYTITTNSYPDVTPLSEGRNKGTNQGRVYLSPTGFTIGQEGNYWVSITAILNNPNPDSTLLIPVFLSVNEEFDPSDPSPIGGAAIVTTNSFTNISGSGILRNVREGDRLSLVATNSGYPDPQDVTVVSWSISLFRLP